MDAVAMGAVSGALLPVVNSYVVYFNPQSASLRSGESRILNQIAREITQYKPSQVTVTSYADSVVAANSQQPLTDERLQMVFTAMNAFGMNTEALDQFNPNNAGVATQLSTIARRQAETVSKELSNRKIPSQIVTSTSRGSLESRLLADNDAETEVTQMVVIDFRK